MENLIAAHRTSPAHLPAPLPAPAHRPPPAQYAAPLTRACRLGKSETLYAFHYLLVARHYSARDLQHAIVRRMHELSTLDRNALLGAKNSQKFQECQGVADACSFCFDLVATHKLSGETLRRRIADHLLAAWPADYRAYRQRCGVSTKQEATLPPARAASTSAPGTPPSTPSTAKSPVPRPPACRPAQTRSGWKPCSTAPPAKACPAQNKLQKKLNQ